MSWQTGVMVGGAILLTLIFLLVESRASEPIIPLRLFRNRTIALASLASLFVGIAMFAGTVYFSQYFQLARDKSPTMSGVMTIPMIGGLFISSTVSGIVITKTGRWKAWLLSGGVLLTAGLGLLSTMRYDTPYWHIGIFMALMGLGVGMMMQNLVLCTQNQVAPSDLGAASSVVTFFRSLGGAVGVSVLGSVMASRISRYAADTIGTLSPQEQAGGGRQGLRQRHHPRHGPAAPGHPHLAGERLRPRHRRHLPVRRAGRRARLPGDDLHQGGPAADHRRAGPGRAGAGRRGGDPVAPAVSEAAVAPAGGAAPAGSAVSETQAAGQDTFAQPVSAVATAARPEESGSAGIPVRGFVRGADSTPVPRAAVTLISLGGRQLGRSVAQDDGSYAVDAPSAGSYVLIAAADGHQPQASTVVVNGEPVSYDVLLSGTSGMTGVVRAADTGQPVKDAMVIVTDVRGDLLATGTTGEQGEFSFTELVPGAVTVAVNAAGYRPRALPVEIGATGVTRVEADLETGAHVRGVVRAPHGPLADARVTLVDAAGNVVGTATTGDDGAYAFADLDGGEYTVIATGYPPVASALTVAGPGVDDHDIELAHPGE